MKGPPRSRHRSDPIGPTVLVAERLHGVRSWELGVDEGGAVRLCGLYRSDSWQREGRTSWARCRPSQGTRSRHKAPHDACDCGLYALHPWNVQECEYVKRAGCGDGLTVVGLVEAWGKVQLHQEGFRAQYARPVALALIGAKRESSYGRLVANLATDHLAELVEVADVPALTGLCADRDLGLSEQAVRSLLAPISRPRRTG